MSRLFILGNGYDEARRGDTKYENFKNWLKINFIDNCGNPFYKDGKISFSNWNLVSELSKAVFDNIIITKNQDEECSLNNCTSEIETQRKELACAILFDSMKRIGDDATWEHFEEDLSIIPFAEIIADFENYNKKHSIILEPTLGSTVNRETSIVTAMPEVIISLFVKWIKSLSPLKTSENGFAFEKEIIKSISSDDIFLIFNYTNTIEELLNIIDCSNIYHIHGTKDNSSSIIVGHNCKEKSDYSSTNNSLSSKEDYIFDAYATLYKNPEYVIRKNTDLWDKISNVSEIYEYGWSCSEVDTDYIVKLINVLKGKECKLYLNDYNHGGKEKLIQWKNNGFPKEFISFYIEVENTIKIYSPELSNLIDEL